ncbi:MAG: hypothetical protein ACE5MI_07150 [Acidimicrobiia bacterium]
MEKPSAPVTSRFGILQIAIVVLTVATAYIHVRVTDFAPFDLFGINSFLLTAAGYVGLLLALYLPIRLLQRYRRPIRWLLILFTAGIVIGWVFIGQRITEAYISKAIEVVLIALLIVEDRQAQKAIVA